MLFSLGGAFSIGEGVRKVLHPGEHGGSLTWAYGVLAGGFVFESISLGVAIHALKVATGDRSFRAYWRENRDPTLPTVVLKDMAVLFSLVVAGAGIWPSAAIREIGCPDEEVVAVVDLRTMHIGPHDVLVVMGTRFGQDLGTERIQTAIERVQRAIKKTIGESTDTSLIGIEPARSAAAASGKQV